MRLFAMSGSLSSGSANTALLRAAVADAVNWEVRVFEQLAEVPLVGASGADDLPVVAALRREVAAADAVLLVTPEYGHSLPGVLKNALDWLVASGDLAGKPVAAVSAAPTPTGGIRAQLALVTTLLAQSAEVVAQLSVPGVRAVLDEDGEVTDAAVRRRLGEALHALAESVERKAHRSARRG